MACWYHWRNWDSFFSHGCRRSFGNWPSCSSKIVSAVASLRFEALSEGRRACFGVRFLFSTFWGEDPEDGGERGIVQETGEGAGTGGKSGRVRTIRFDFKVRHTMR